ncbi:ARM repeat-containing protein [Fomitopsis serialis]|uniref:ARM repeat-containing protein n=1 Tax=Fomitopsis serialis TaxID=139415 RepID=UPI0020077AA6|nr:ARM repeat-containing protein [Neoantrodia serialis]KAH9937428.1 ARM repeat-containing protein [Neoantrodia serialis]
MEDDDLSLYESPTWDSGTLTPGQSAFERHKASLQTLLDWLPYECESVEDMQTKLEYIVSRLTICAESRNWLALTTWDGILQCWLLMHYPMPKPMRIKLVHFYYELCLIPGIESRVVRSWADILSRLLANKPDQRRKLETTDLQLSWRPLWRVLQKELWPKRRLQDSSRNMINILLFVAEQSKRYYPAGEIPEMMAAFLPLLTKDSVLTIMPVMTSFLPPTHSHLYLPSLFKIWEAFNSSVIDDRMIDLCGSLSEEHVAGKAGDAEGGAAWQDIGIWTEPQFQFLAGKALNSMHVPVGGSKGASTTAMHADLYGDKNAFRIKKPINRANGLAKLFVFSMCLDGPVREETGEMKQGQHFSPQPTGYLAGSKALDYLDKMITSTETYFHPSNHGIWSLILTMFLHRLTAEFSKRWQEEQEPTCKTPVTRRLTFDMRHAFVTTLRTAALLSMFSKDPFTMGYAQASLRSLAFIEPKLIMPDLLERAYNGLEVVNETHRTTAVLTMLAGVAHPLVCEKAWLGGQKHVVPLLELCIPGIDLNDHIKTVCACMFISSVVQHIRIGDVSMHSAGVPLTDDAAAGEMMDVDHAAGSQLPDRAVGAGAPIMNKEEERAAARESTTAFADWVTALFRRVLALYENLPEEGGRRATTGGKMEESVLSATKNMLDIVCLHLSDALFDLVLKLVYDYATTNAKANAVRAFGQMISCLSRAQPEKTVAKFLPFCIDQIKEELRHGASGVRTTSVHTPTPSDTTLHWNISILRGCFAYGGVVLLKYKPEILALTSLLVEKTKSERGYSSSGRLLNRILSTLTTVYPVNNRCVNTKDWNRAEFDQIHLKYWGTLYDPQDAEIEWHVPSSDEIAFALEIVDKISSLALSKVEALAKVADNWDEVARNDFCRYLCALRSMWSGLSTLIQEGPKDVVKPCLNAECELPELLVTSLDVKCGFALTDMKDPQYQKALSLRTRYGEVIHGASVALRQLKGGDDHLDALVGLSKSIDVYLLDYAMTRSTFDSLRKAYIQSRDATRMWSRQRSSPRMVLIRRAHAYHAGRVYMHALYRRRSQLDDHLLQDLVEMSLSPYLRLRKHAQAVLYNACGYFVRSTRLCLPHFFGALAKGTDPDRMKGALHVLWNKGIASYALADIDHFGQYLLSVLDCQHQEKPSIQKILGNLAQDATAYLSEDAIHTETCLEDHAGVVKAVAEIKQECDLSPDHQSLSLRAAEKQRARTGLRNKRHADTVSTILDIATRPTTHWRYVEMATQFLYHLLRRDTSPAPELASFFVAKSVDPHPTTRHIAQKAVVRLTYHVKIRTYAQSNDDLWLDEWRSPLQTDISIADPAAFLSSQEQIVQAGSQERSTYVDKIPTGFVVWPSTLKAYRVVPEGEAPFSWDTSSIAALQSMKDALRESDFVTNLVSRWSQESSKNIGSPELRVDNVTYMKSLAKMFQHELLELILPAIEPMLKDADRFKQRAGAEMLIGLLRGSKHWPKQWRDQLWGWFMSQIQAIHNSIRPDTLSFWDAAFNELLMERDPWRAEPFIKWILSLPLDFHGDSTFAMTKSLILFNAAIDSLGLRFLPVCNKYMHLFLDNANTGYAEIRTQIAQNLHAIIATLWRPTYPSTDAFLSACERDADPLRVREARYMDRIMAITQQFPQWRSERLPPPRVSQSQYDKVGLTMLQWFWECSHNPQAVLVLPYLVTMLPEVLRMSELNDNSELQKYSSAVLYVLSAVDPPQEYVGVIAENFLQAIKSSSSWRIRLKALPTLLVFYYRNLMSIPGDVTTKIMEVLLDCLADENVEVRDMASKMLSGVVRCSQRHSILSLKDHFLASASKARLPNRRDPTYAESMRTLHSAILGLCALVDSFPYSVEPWMPLLTDVLALHATDPAPISTTIRKCASEFKKTHQDTWHKDQLAFDEDQLQNLSTMLVGTSYYA